MSKKDREGPSKRQEFREKRRRAQQRNRWIWIGLIVAGAFLIAFVLIYPQLKPAAGILTADPRARPNVNRNSTGNPNAPVKLVEFSDFQCPYCKEFWTSTEAQLISTYVTTGKVLYTYRSAGNWVSGNIGDGGVESQDSAMAAYCAADQNKFWEMHDALFTNVLGEDAGSFTDRRLQAIAQSIGLDMSAFNSCYSSQKYLDQANQDFKDAQASGIQGTPWFILSYSTNGQVQTSSIDGAQPFSVFQQDIDTALAAAGAQ
ncbi:MAG TPA: thioredoxin domain-containing protein [Anaerolineales bacterium]|nr:thioredoxin domain-containing protein [Anaerolineales bacterium]